MFVDTKITPSILGAVPGCLKDRLEEIFKDASGSKKSALLGSNNLANRFIFERWGIRASRRRHHKPLFKEIRDHTRRLFEHHLRNRRIEWVSTTGEKYLLGVTMQDAIRGNLILNFIRLDPNDTWMIPKG